MPNLVFKTTKDLSPLNETELADEFWFYPNSEEKKKKHGYDMDRLKGGHCACNGNGRFLLFPITDEAVQEGGKRYMRCTKCMGVSHL